jgi:hypothetical protein
MEKSWFSRGRWKSLHGEVEVLALLRLKLGMQGLGIINSEIN